MKRITLVLSLLICSFKILFGQIAGGYEIIGRLDGVPENCTARMSLFEISGWKEMADSAAIKHGEFHLYGKIPEGPRQCELYIYKKGEPWKAIRMFLDNNEKITISSPDVNKIDAGMFIDQFCTIEGSKSNYARETFLPTSDLWRQDQLRLRNYVKTLTDSIGFDRSAMKEIAVLKDLLDKSYYYQIFDEPARSKPAWPWLVWYWGEYTHSPFLIDAYNDLDDLQKNSFFGRAAKEQTKFCITQLFPEFSLPTAEGKRIVLKDLISKGKLTIVHFWASNSFNRQGYDDELKIFYKKYHDKGLNIVGVSSDYRESQYKEALTKGQFPWANVSDLKGGDGVVNTVYHEWGSEKTPNTTNVLVDQQGKIVAWDISGPELQYLLLKYLGE